MDTIYYANYAAKHGTSCEVRLDGDDIVVSTAADEDAVLYSGKQLSEGHFHLASSNPKGTATLHCFVGSRILEGFWMETADSENDGSSGFWRITFDANS